MNIKLIAAVLSSFVLPVLGSNTPIVKEEQWTTSLNEKIGVSNIVEWINEGEKILVTHENCGITILSKYGYIENSRQGSNETTCASGVGFLPDGSIIQAVNPIAETNTSSYIQSLNITDLSQKWNASVVGTIEGTPKVGSYIYLVHNNRKNETFHEAYLSLLSHEGVNLYSEKKDNIRFSPLSIQTNPPRGPYTTGNDNTNDLVAWGKLYSPGNGFFSGGSNYYFQLPKTFTGNTDDVLQNLIRSGPVSGFTRSAPELTNLYTNVYYSLELYKIRCWVSESSDDIWNWGRSPNIKITPPPSESGGNSLPPPNSPTVSMNGDMLFISGSENNPGVHAYNINFTEYSEAWSRNATYVASKMKLAFNDTILFYVESSIDDKTSKIVGVNVTEGEVCFEHEVEDKSYGEFSIYDDSYIVYGTNNGNVTAIKIKNITNDIIASMAPSLLPSMIPSVSVEPSRSPSVSPSSHPSVSSNPSQEPTAMPSLSPSLLPSESSSNVPSEMPTKVPSTVPSVNPSMGPTKDPSEKPSFTPTSTPSRSPSLKPITPGSSTNSKNSSTKNVSSFSMMALTFIFYLANFLAEC